MTTEKISIKDTATSVDVSATKSEKEEKKRDRVYSEWSYSSFYRKIVIPQEILPSRVSASMNNGLLIVKLPKKNSSRSIGQPTKVEVR